MQVVKFKLTNQYCEHMMPVLLAFRKDPTMGRVRVISADQKTCPLLQCKSCMIEVRLTEPYSQFE